MATPIVPAALIDLTIVHRCGHTAVTRAYPATAAQLVASAASWLCKSCTLVAPERKFGRGRGSLPLVSRLQS